MQTPILRAPTPVASISARSQDADCILENDEWGFEWTEWEADPRSVWVGKGICPQKTAELVHLDSAGIEAVLEIAPALFLQDASGNLRLLDGSHRLARAVETSAEWVKILIGKPQSLTAAPDLPSNKKPRPSKAP